METNTTINTSIKETDRKEIAAGLVDGHETVVRTARSVFPVVEKAADVASADLLTQRIQVHEKTAWMLRSLLEA
jgi:starvation-inducible DNA-binding protein